MTGYVVITGDTFSRIVENIDGKWFMPFHNVGPQHALYLLPFSVHLFLLPTLLPPISPIWHSYYLLLAFPPILKDEWLIKLVMVVVVMLPLSMLRNIARLEKVGNINC